MTNFDFYQDNTLWIFNENFHYTHAYVVGGKILYFTWGGDNHLKNNCVLQSWDSVEAGSDYLDRIDRAYTIDYVPVSLAGILATKPEWQKRKVITVLLTDGTIAQIITSDLQVGDYRQLHSHDENGNTIKRSGVVAEVLEERELWQ